MNTFPSRLGTSARVATVVIGLTSVCFGLVPLFAKVLLEAGLSAEAVALYRFGFTLPIALYFFPRHRCKLRPALILLGGGLAMGLGWTTYLRSLDHLPVASAGVVYMSYPVFVVVIAWLILRQPLGVRALVSALMVLLAAAFAFSPSEITASDGQYLLACLPAPIGFALIVVLIATMGRELSVTERWSCVSAGAVLGLLPMSLAMDPQGLVPSHLSAWFWALAMTLVTAAIPQIIYTYVAPQVGAARAAAAGAVELPTMFAIGWIAFAESISFGQGIAAVLIVGAVILAPVVRLQPSPGRHSLQAAMDLHSR